MHVRSCEFQSRTVCNGKRVKVKFEFQCLRNFPISSRPLLYHVLLLNIYDENLQGFEVGMGCLIGNGHPVTKSLSEISG